MIKDWRRLLQWRQQDAQGQEARNRVRSVQGSQDQDPPDEKNRREPTFPRDANVARMDFLLSLRRRGISDANVLRAMDKVPRQDFVLPEFVDVAYADQAMPIACGQTISQPYVVAYMSEQLAVKRDHRVLEIGTGSGYQAAVLSQLAGAVYSVERYRTLAERARETLRRLGYDNVTVVVGDGLNGLPEHAPYDRIIVTAAAETIPEKLVEQLAVGGILLLPLGKHDGAQHIVKLTMTEAGPRRQELLPVRFVPLLPGQAREL